MGLNPPPTVSGGSSKQWPPAPARRTDAQPLRARPIAPRTRCRRRVAAECLAPGHHLTRPPSRSPSTPGPTRAGRQRGSGHPCRRQANWQLAGAPARGPLPRPGLPAPRSTRGVLNGNSEPPAPPSPLPVSSRPAGANLLQRPAPRQNHGGAGLPLGQHIRHEALQLLMAELAAARHPPERARARGAGASKLWWDTGGCRAPGRGSQTCGTRQAVPCYRDASSVRGCWVRLSLNAVSSQGVTRRRTNFGRAPGATPDLVVATLLGTCQLTPCRARRG